MSDMSSTPQPDTDAAAPIAQSAHTQTAAVHAGAFVMPSNAPAAPPLFQAAAYRFRDLDDVEAIYGGTKPGAIYGRYGGPNGAQFAAAIAELEGATAAVAASSGMAAIHATLAVTVTAGDTILATRDIYGGTYELLEHDYAAKGVRVAYFDPSDANALDRALREYAPRVIYIEALTNPLMRVANIPFIAERAHAAGAKVFVDATFASPVLITPLAHGADIVVHSVTKYIGGHGDVGAGVAAGDPAIIEKATEFLVRTGASIPHFEAWLALRGLRTLALRMRAHSENAVAVAQYLATEAHVVNVHHPAIAAHPQHELARTLYPQGTGGMLAFDLDGGRDMVDRFLRGLRVIAIVHSLGEVGTTIGYSAAASHRALPEELRAALGVTPGTLRISVGIEHPDDIIADLKTAFAGL